MAKDGFIDVEVSGLMELERALSALPDAMARSKVFAASVAAGARVVRKEAQRRCPVVTGNLRRSIKIKRKFNKAGLCIYQVGPGRSGKKNGKYEVDGFYGLMVEFGTSGHRINVDKRKVLMLRKNKRASGRKPGTFKGYANRWVALVSGGVVHPGAKPRPFLRPAFDASTGEVIRVMQRRLKAGIEREARKLAKARNQARRLARRR